MNKQFSFYMKEVSEKIEQRKLLNKKICEFLMNYFKYYEKAYHTNPKEVMANF
jgi:hypothetical protein